MAGKSSSYVSMLLDLMIISVIRASVNNDSHPQMAHVVIVSTISVLTSNMFPSTRIKEKD